MHSCFSTTRLCFVGSDHSPLASHGGSGVAYIANWECHMKQMVIGASAFAALLLAAAAASARNSDMMRVRGTLQGVDGQTLDVKGRDGTPIKVKLADDVKVLAVDRKSMDDVKQGVFVGTTAMPQPDGSQRPWKSTFFPKRCAARAKDIALGT